MADKDNFKIFGADRTADKDNLKIFGADRIADSKTNIIFRTGADRIRSDIGQYPVYPISAATLFKTHMV